MKCAFCGKTNRMMWLYYGEWICNGCWKKEKKEEGIRNIRRIKKDYGITNKDI